MVPNPEPSTLEVNRTPLESWTETFRMQSGHYALVLVVSEALKLQLSGRRQRNTIPKP